MEYVSEWILAHAADPHLTLFRQDNLKMEFVLKWMLTDVVGQATISKE